MSVHHNTLYVFTQGAYLHRDHQTVKVESEGKTVTTIPIHHLDMIAAFGRVMISPSLMELCHESGVGVTFLSESGRLMARMDAPKSGNVLLRREQFRRADHPESCLALAKSFVAGKLHNCRNALLRAARESRDPDDTIVLNQTASRLGEQIRMVGRSTTMDEVRGREGESARSYFAALPRMIRQQRNDFPMNGRTRRPPLDAMNALLSFVYALVTADCVAGLTAAGLDPDVGFLHTDRPGKPSLALDLTEEFRGLIADRLILSLINRQQIRPEQFLQREGGAVEMSAEARKTLVQAYVMRKREELTHPLLDKPVRVGQLWFIQAKLLARHLRGDSDIYLPCTPR